MIDDPRSAAPHARELMWLHCEDPKIIDAACHAAKIMQQDRPDTGILLTCPDAQTACKPDIFELSITTPPRDQRSLVSGFFERWRPSAMVWFGGLNRPWLLRQTQDRNIPIAWVTGGAETLAAAQRRGRIWTPRRNWNRFHRIVSPTDKEITFGALATDPVGQLHVVHEPPDVPQTTLAALTRQLGPRPIWLALCVNADQLNAVLDAHRRATRLAHRLMLILVPCPDTDPKTLQEGSTGQGRIAEIFHDAKDLPPDIEILIARQEDPIGLWYSLAAVTVMAASFRNGGGPSPMNPAALGSAILCGKNWRNHEDDYARLNAALGCYLLEDFAQLGAAIERFSEPENAARLAKAAWNCATEGALALESLAEIMHDLLDTSA